MSSLVNSLGPGAVFEGPFGDHTGFYSLPDRYPIMDVTAITHRRKAIFPAIIVGPPPQEDYYMGKATERIFLPLLRTLIPDIEDYHLPMFGCFHNCAFIKIRKSYPLHARRVMHAIWGAGQMSWTKYIIVVEDDVNVHDETAVLRAMFEQCQFARDVEMVHGPLDVLDHAAARLGAGGKMGFDATHKIAGEEINGIDLNAPPPVKPRDSYPSALRGAADSTTVYPDFGASRCVFISVQKLHPGDGARAIENHWKHSPPGIADFVIAVNADVDRRDWQSVLFHWCANTDPSRDIHREITANATNTPGTISENTPGTITGRIGFDATKKMPGDERCGQPVRDYPPIMVMSDEVQRRVDARAAESGLA